MSAPIQLGRYAVRRRIGSGGFATVWLAYDEHLDAPVAIKVLADNWSEQHHIRTRFVEEGRFLRRVESPHVVPVYDAGETDDGRPFLVMAYADQGSLAERLEHGTLTVAQTIEVVRQIGAGLQALHDRGVLHRDLKPANVLFRTVDPSAGEAGVRAMVGDLGLGKALDASSKLTMIGGTPAFVAPEQAQGETPDARADQYSLGVLTFLLLSGRLPWGHATLPAAASADPGPPEPLSDDGAFGPEVENVVMRALSRDRQWRFESVTAYCEALEYALRDHDADVAPDTRRLPVDPARTQPGVRPTPLPADESATRNASTEGDDETEHPASRRRWARGAAAVAVVAVLALVAGTVGWFAMRAAEPTRTVHDERDVLGVTVPEHWDVTSTEAWTPPDGSGDAYPALAVGDRRNWQSDASGEGVFAGLLPLNRLPTEVPEHAECTGSSEVVRGSRDGYANKIVYSDGCPGGLLIEALFRVAENRVLWVQVKAPDRGTANEVLDSLTVDGA